MMHSRHGSSCFSASRLSEILKRSNNIWSTHSVELQCASMQLVSCLAWRRLPVKTSSARKNPNVSLLQGGMTCLFPGPRLGPESALPFFFCGFAAQEAAGPALLLASRRPVWGRECFLAVGSRHDVGKHHRRRQEVCGFRLRIKSSVAILSFDHLGYGTVSDAFQETTGSSAETTAYSHAAGLKQHCRRRYCYVFTRCRQHLYE